MCCGRTLHRSYLRKVQWPIVRDSCIPSRMTNETNEISSHFTTYSCQRQCTLNWTELEARIHMHMWVNNLCKGEKCQLLTLSLSQLPSLYAPYCLRIAIKYFHRNVSCCRLGFCRAWKTKRLILLVQLRTHHKNPVLYIVFMLIHVINYLIRLLELVTTKAAVTNILWHKTAHHHLILYVLVLEYGAFFASSIFLWTPWERERKSKRWKKWCIQSHRNQFDEEKTLFWMHLKRWVSCVTDFILE